MGRADPFQKLHIFELAMVAELLPPVDIVRLRRVSSTWNAVLSSDYICKVALQAHFPYSKETRSLRGENALATTQSIDSSKPPVLAEGAEKGTRSGKRSGKAAAGGKKSLKPQGPRRSLELQSIIASNRLNRTQTLSDISLSFSRATYRLHSRAIAKPTKVHKYRLHHICDRGFTSTPRYLFWCESNRKIWQQKIGEGISGRRGLKLGSVGNRIAHVHQITAVEDVPGRNGSGLVVLLFREVLTWGLEMAALDYETDEVVWKVSLVDNPNSLQRTRNWVHYLTQTQVSSNPITGGPAVQECRYMLVVHCIFTGKILTQAVLNDSWPRQKRSGYPGNLPENPGAYTVFPSTTGGGRPEKMVVAFEDKGSRIPGEEVPKKAAYKILVYSVAGGLSGDGVLLKEIELERSGIGIGNYLVERAIRIEFSSEPSAAVGHPNLLLIESTSHPHIVPPKTRNSMERLEYPTLSVWTLETVNFDILEIRRYQSRYADDEMRPTLETRDEYHGRQMAEYTRMEALNVESGISWLIFDENKSPQKAPSGDHSEEESDGEASPATAAPIMQTYNNSPPAPHNHPMTARIDTVGYEEVLDGAWSGIWWEGIKEAGDTKKEEGVKKEEGLLGQQMSAATGGTRKRKRCSSSLVVRPGSAASNSSGSSSGASSATTASTLYPQSPFVTNSSTQPGAASLPRERWFRQISRHKLQQPDIMRRRRRQILGEEEEDWGMLPVRTNPTIFLGGTGARGGLEADEDGRYLVVLTRVKGWTSMALCMDFDPEW